jgi:hypothetical protein
MSSNCAARRPSVHLLPSPTFREPVQVVWTGSAFSTGLRHGIENCLLTSNRSGFNVD